MFNYIQAMNDDVITAMLPGFKRGTFHIRDDGRIGMRTDTMWNTPWVHAGIPTDRNCVFYFSLVLNYFPFIPERCQNCWKVVARPRTVKELFDVSEIQLDSPRPSKAGIEKRSRVGGNYGAYWYNDSVEEGHECKAYVESIVPDGVEVFLKRGCTEFEHKYGDSTGWEVTPEARKLEDRLDDLIVVEDIYGEEKQIVGREPQPEIVKIKTRRMWIEFAYERGDKTYKEFTNGRPLYPEYVKYYSEDETEESMSNGTVIETENQPLRVE